MAKVIHVHLLHKNRRDEAERLVFQQYIGCLYGSDGRSGGGNQELPASCRAVW